MAEHECVIGLLYGCNLATISEVKDNIGRKREYNSYLRETGVVTPFIYEKEWTLKDYADKRKSTDLTRFDFCPYCGRPIDWKAIRRMSDG